MNRTSKLSLFIAVLLLLQISLGGWPAAPQMVSAAASGPVALNLTPADDLINVPINADLKITFDESVMKGSGSTYVSIYEYGTSRLLESISVASHRITFDSTQRIVTIDLDTADPARALALNTNYYVLIDPGAFVNVSNGVGFAGVNSAGSWNFRTVAVTDVTRPLLAAKTPEGASAPIASPITITFDEPVFAASGNIQITSVEDTRTISVTSSAVRGSGTTQILIQPPAALQPNTNYTISIPDSAFQDEAGNLYIGTTWAFSTSAAPVNAVAPFSPADNATSIPINTTLSITLDNNVQARSGKFVEIRRISNNSTFERFEATSARISVTNNVVTITPSTSFEANTAYYVLIDAGAFTLPDPSGSEWYHGIAGASIWNFSTDPGNETNPPTISAVSPVHNGVLGSLNTQLQLTFNEPVFPSSGNIEIRNAANGALFRTIPITSERITGGGTYQFTIDPNKAIAGDVEKPFMNNTKYYVTIGNRAIRDAAGNHYAGITASNVWTFTVSQDSVRPTLNSLSPVNGAATVQQNATFIATFNEAIMKVNGSNGVQFHQSGTGAPGPINANFSVDPADNKRLLITAPPNTLNSNTSYYIIIENNAVSDLAGNPFVGILNEYQWTFKTIGSDVTPPTVSKAESAGSTIKLTYNEELNAGLWPSPGSYYITVNGAPRPVTNVQVTGETVVLNLLNPIVNGQQVKLSYSKPATGLVQDLSGNQAASLSAIDVANAQDTTAPMLVGGTASGSLLTLTFSEELTQVNNYAYTQFTVNVGGTNYNGTSISNSGAVVRLTINGAIQNGQYVRVSYSPGSYPLRDTAGNYANAINSVDLSGSVDTRGPGLQSISANGLSIILKYDENISFQSVPSSFQYSVLIDNAIRTVSQVSVSGDSVILTLSTNILTGQEVKVSYIAGSNTVTDSLGNAAISFSSVSANGSGTGQSGSLIGAIVKGSSLTLTFSDILSVYSVPSSSLFLVRINDSVKMVSKVDVGSLTVTLTLASPAGVGERASVSYFSNSAGLKLAAGQLIDSFSNVNAANQTTLLDTLSGDYEAADGGVGLKTIASTTSTDVSPAGNTATRYTVMNDKFLSAYQTARAAGLASPRIVFKVPNTERAAIVAIPVVALDMAYRQGGNTVFAVQYGDVTYELPLSVINYTEISALMGGSGVSNQLLIEVDQGASSKTASLSTLLHSSNAQVIAGPLNFEVSITNGTSEKPLNDFSGYVTRTIQTNSIIDPNQSAVVWYDPQTGAMSYVPTEFSTSGGRTTAAFKRKGNSSYALVRNSSSFSDVTKHWAATAINTMARKYIVEGRTTAKFEPEKPITRGEFATYIAKGLGLSGDKSAAAKFKDVNTSTAMGAYIGAASAAGIVQGNTDQTFKPNSLISRQEMAVMMIRASKVAGLSVQLPQSTTAYLKKFTDRGKIGSWAQTDVAKAVFIGVINGKTANTMSPQTNATRAEGTVMIMRLLQKVKFISP